MLKGTGSLFKPRASVCGVVCHLSTRTQKMLEEITNLRPLTTQVRKLPRLQDSYTFHQFVEETKLRWTQAMCLIRGMAWRSMSLLSMYAQHTVELTASAWISFHQVSDGEHLCRSRLCWSSAGGKEVSGCSLAQANCVSSAVLLCCLFVFFWWTGMQHARHEVILLLYLTLILPWLEYWVPLQKRYGEIPENIPQFSSEG